jgi:DNA-binding Lrp family transcriptional regulator
MTRIRFVGLAAEASQSTPMRGHPTRLRWKASAGAYSAQDRPRLPAPSVFAGLRAHGRESRKRSCAVKKAPRMTPFFVQIKCQLGKSYLVANELAESEIASEIYSTAGDFDLLVKFYVEPGTDIGHFVNEKVQVIPGIQDTRTIITFKAFNT